MRFAHAWCIAVYRFAPTLTMQLLGIGCLLIFALPIHAAFTGPYAVDNFVLVNTNSDGSSTTLDNGITVDITGGNNGTGLPGSTYMLMFAAQDINVSFRYSYITLDQDPTFDTPGYLAAGKFWPLPLDAPPDPISFLVAQGQGFGFGVETLDNWGGPGILTISDFQADAAPQGVPEPGFLIPFLVAGVIFAGWRSLRARRLSRSAPLALAISCIGAVGLVSAPAFSYRGADATGRLVLTHVTNVAQTAAVSAFRVTASQQRTGPDFKQHVVEPHRQPTRFAATSVLTLPAGKAFSAFTALPSTNFLGLTHYDQRNANNGNQYSVEPPSPALAVANDWILEGVNNAIQVYSTSGTPLLAKTLSTNELFAVTPAIIWNTGVNGVYPTDMRVFYDHGMDRWFVLQRAQDYDTAGFPLNSSHLYLAVSQTGDPTGNYNIYTMDTTNATRAGCPCFSDYPQIGADQYGIYISSDEYDTVFGGFADVSILAISKAALAAGSPSPVMQEIVVPRLTGFEATIRPAITPPGGSYALARGGIEFFLSTQSLGFGGTSFGLWALTNTASLNTTPDLVLTQAIIPGMSYAFPDVATQRPGFLEYGSTLIPPGQLAFIDGGRDSRVLSLVYVAGRLCVTFATQALDEDGRSVVAGAYAVMFPSFRDQNLSAPVWTQRYIIARGNSVLRPAVSVDAQGRGAIAFTLAGPDYFPSAAFLPVDGFAPGTTTQIAADGVGPEDGFSGYPDTGFFSVGIARWGDYSGAITTANGATWMVSEYIPGSPRTDLANWGTRVVRRP